MKGGVFFDINLLVYAALQPDPRSNRARDLLARGGTVSVQVLNEFAIDSALIVLNGSLGAPVPRA